MNTTASINTTNIYPFHFEYYVTTWVTTLIGTIFSCLSLIRYFRYNYQRTQLTYVYHFSLGFSLVLSLISTPLHTSTGYFLSILSIISEYQFRLLCNFNLISFFVASAGIGYSIAYASLERTFFIFYSQNIRLTWIRQFTPFLIIFSSCSLVITLFILLSKCSSDISLHLLGCFESLKLQIIWFLLQFLIPFIFMLISILFLIYRIEIHTNRIRISLNRKRSRNKFQRILIHLNIYNAFYMLSICPMNIYSFIRIYMNIKQRFIEIILINYSFMTLNCYSILIFLLTQVKQQHRIKFYQEQKRSPFIIITHPSTESDEYQRTRL
ncbi:unnamed protein product [Rotaria sp. Silwood2]|nr:unnamed protein product [Rotaria sp. Silwood2]CAF2727028.1 unnamed protein product [Rotaria sp. Silwood2]CAF2952332.1 unnamed protein product [Rotaria sp. Silwood2]CAF3995061.1 unnamed protein product [Rotaria sp. Silwood2]CAF4056467.1 unnamed protein product [Rotaria sp. Silwood2]